ncbi:hypothetical protein [Paenibacillus sp. IHBB 3054]|uniref:hypothetical protein n=1 Tax=Paenibacillus sp. IHBB 3054 TaxID=3425689 RepID=UPI003F675325
MKLDKVRCFLKSGAVIEVVCGKWGFVYDDESLEFIGYEFIGIKGYKKVSIVPSQIAAYTVEDYLDE